MIMFKEIIVLSNKEKRLLKFAYIQYILLAITFSALEETFLDLHSHHALK